MMSYAFDRFLPTGVTWRDLFSVIVVSARKPGFFQGTPMMFEVVEPSGLLRPAEGIMREGTVYFGGTADHVERALGLDGDQILYVGDHMFGDVRQSKKMLQWRTAMILRELEDEIGAITAWRPNQRRVDLLMAEKERLEHAFSQLRLVRMRQRSGYAECTDAEAAEVTDKLNVLRERLVSLDNTIAPLAAAAGQLHNHHWGLMMRAGNDKSLLARQIEQHADVYTSRVSNFLHETPFAFLRSLRGSLPHDMGAAGDVHGPGADGQGA